MKPVAPMVITDSERVDGTEWWMMQAETPAIRRTRLAENLELQKRKVMKWGAPGAQGDSRCRNPATSKDWPTPATTIPPAKYASRPPASSTDYDTVPKPKGGGNSA